MPGKTREQLQKEFEEGVLRLWNFYKKEGHCNVHREHKEEDGYFLGRFVKNTLSKYRNGYLSDKNIAKIAELPGWQWAPKKSGQNKKIMTLVNTLKKFHEEHDHLRVPPDLEVNGENISKLIIYYKGRYTSGRATKKEISCIETIPDWTWGRADNSHTFEEKWERKFQLLIKYAIMNGHTYVPQLFVIDGEKLGSWTERQRLKYENGDLLEHRKKRLESLALWEWHKPNNEDFFNSALICLIEYFHNNGPKMPPKNYKTPHGTSLNEWVLSQRAKYKAGNLPKEKIRRLESIPGWSWSKNESIWNKKFKSLQEFNNRFAHCEVPRTYKSNGAYLRGWVNKVRLAYVKNELEQYQVEALNNLKGWGVFLKKSQLFLKGLPINSSDKAVFQRTEQR